MTSAGKSFLIGGIGFAIAVNVCSWLMLTCDHEPWAGLINGGSCAEFWLNRYQAFIAGMAALGGAWITIATMRRQSERARSDEAERRLALYAVGLLDLMKNYGWCTEFGIGQTEALKRIEDLKVASNSPVLRGALMDGILGPEINMLSLFLNLIVVAAAAHVNGNHHYDDMIWPLYMSLTEDINTRQSMLMAGAKVSELYPFGTINHEKYHRA
jgi:hypothetical protein